MNFQLSYELKSGSPLPLFSFHSFFTWSDAAYLQGGNYDDWEEGNRILDAMIKADREE